MKTDMPAGPVVFAYGRHSTQKQEITREVQEHRLRDYYERNLKDKGYAWGGFFYDAATQGRVPFSEREQGKVVFTMARPGDAVIVTKLDRSFRSLRDGISVMDQLAARDVSFQSLDLMIDTKTPLGKFFRTILLAVAELEREFVKERTKDAIDQKRREGKPVSRNSPIGWKIVGVKRDRKFVIDYEERELVAKFAMDRANGKAYEEIAERSRLKRPGYFCKRTFGTPRQVRLAITAMRLGFPKDATRETLHEAWLSRQVALGQA